MLNFYTSHCPLSIFSLLRLFDQTPPKILRGLIIFKKKLLVVRKPVLLQPIYPFILSLKNSHYEYF
jgi:hypothetical protein